MCSCGSAWAQNPYARIQPANPLSGSPSVEFNFFEPKRATLTKNDVYNQYAIGLNRFMQSNVRSAYADFTVLIESIQPNDYAYLDKVGDDLGVPRNIKNRNEATMKI